MLEKRHGPLACPSLSRASLSQSSGRPYSSSRATANPYPNRPRFRFICLSNTSTPCFLLSAFTVTPFPFPSFRAGTSTYYHSTTAGPRVKSWKCSAIIPVRQSRLVIHACVHCSVSQASAGLKKDAWPARPGRSFRMLTCFQVERSPVGDFWLCCSLLLLRLHDTWIGVTWRLISNSFRAVSRGSTARTGTGTGPSLCAVPGNGK